MSNINPVSAARRARKALKAYQTTGKLDVSSYALCHPHESRVWEGILKDVPAAFEEYVLYKHRKLLEVSVPSIRRCEYGEDMLMAKAVLLACYLERYKEHPELCRKIEQLWLEQLAEFPEFAAARLRVPEYLEGKPFDISELA